MKTTFWLSINMKQSTEIIMPDQEIGRHQITVIEKNYQACLDRTNEISKDIIATRDDADQGYTLELVGVEDKPDDKE